MDQFDNISENEIRIIGANPDERPEPPKKKNWFWFGLAASILVVAVILWFAKGCKGPSGTPVYNAVEQQDTLYQHSFVEISDTIINNVSLHRYIPVNAKPKLVLGLIKEIPPYYILGAMAADFGLYNDEYKVTGGFVLQGEMLSHSKSKYGFCALLKDTVVIGKDLTTSYFEKAIEEKGDFFRQHALVQDSKVVNKVLAKDEALRRSLCKLKDGRLCIIDTDMSVTFDSFATALCQYGVKDAISLMGSGAAVRWAVDRAGRRYIAGADEYDFPDVVNYIVWENQEIKKK